MTPEIEREVNTRTDNMVYTQENPTEAQKTSANTENLENTTSKHKSKDGSKVSSDFNNASECQPSPLLPKEGKEHVKFAPPDGGWGWIVCIASFWTNGTIFGIINSSGIIYVKLRDMFADKYERAGFLTSWVGSVAIGMTFLASPVASILTDKFGIRKTAFLGALIATTGMLLSSFSSHLEMLYLTYGFLLGLGSSLAYTPSIVILGHYFKERIGLVNGIVTAGSSIFTMVLPFLMRYLIDTVGFSATLQVLSFLISLLMLCGLTYKPLLPSSVSSLPDHQNHYSSLDSINIRPSYCRRCCYKYLNLSIWRNKRYLIWVFSIPVALFGYFVPYIHLVKHAKDILPDANAETLVMCIGLTSGIGRLTFGRLADFPKVNRIYLQQISFLSIGALTMLLVTATNFGSLVAVCLALGLFDGCFISLLGPIAFDIVGHKGASQAIGFLLGLCSIPLTIGPPIAGFLYDKLGNYRIAFLLAGIPPIVGAFLLILIHRIPQAKSSEEVEQHMGDLAAENWWLRGEDEQVVKEKDVKLSFQEQENETHKKKKSYKSSSYDKIYEKKSVSYDTVHRTMSLQLSRDHELSKKAGGLIEC